MRSAQAGVCGLGLAEGVIAIETSNYCLRVLLPEPRQEAIPSYTPQPAILVGLGSKFQNSPPPPTWSPHHIHGSS